MDQQTTAQSKIRYQSAEALFHSKALQLMGQLKLLFKQATKPENFIQYRELVYKCKFLTELVMEFRATKNHTAEAQTHVYLTEIAEMLNSDENPFEKILNPKPGAGIGEIFKGMELRAQLALG